MRDFGELSSLSLQRTPVVPVIQFVCSLYQENKATSDINELQYEIFTQKNVSGDRLPPTLNALVFHLRRVNYQTFTWKSGCVPVLTLPLPNGTGLQMEGLKLCEEFMLNSSVPDATVEFTRHKCRKGCKTNSSSCKRVNLVCTDLCSCNINDDYENTNHDKLYESDEEENDSDQLTK